MEPWDVQVERLWLYASVPALALAGAVGLVLSRVAPFTRLLEGWRALAHQDTSAPGDSPGNAVALATVATVGAGAAVSGASAVALGGAGALAWLWLFGILLAPLRFADVFLARTSPPGRARGVSPGSLVARAEAAPGRWAKFSGRVLAFLLVLVSTAGVAALHGLAVRRLTELVVPGGESVLGLVLAFAAAAVAWFGRGRTSVGWAAVGALAALALMGFFACLIDPGRALGVLPIAIVDVFEGASSSGAFSGALASEVAAAALFGVLPSMTVSLGFDGALLADARGSTKSIAASALLPTLAHVVVATLVGTSLLATGAFERRVDDVRALAQVRFYDAPFDTVSQRLEPERAWTGFVRVVEGRAQASPFEVATERGMVREPRFRMADGTPGDFAMRIERGVVVDLLFPDEHGALQRAPERLSEVRVAGAMLPTGARLLVAAMTRLGGDVAARLVVAILLVLASLGAAAIGLGLARSLESRLGRRARVAAFAPALGLAIASIGPAIGLPTTSLSSIGLGSVAAASLMVALVLLARFPEVSRLDASVASVPRSEGRERRTRPSTR